MGGHKARRTKELEWYYFFKVLPLNLIEASQLAIRDQTPQVE
jgi:hypothetical protein